MGIYATFTNTEHVISTLSHVYLTTTLKGDSVFLITLRHRTSCYNGHTVRKQPSQQVQISKALADLWTVGVLEVAVLSRS